MILPLSLKIPQDCCQHPPTFARKSTTSMNTSINQQGLKTPLRFIKARIKTVLRLQSGSSSLRLRRIRPAIQLQRIPARASLEATAPRTLVQ